MLAVAALSSEISEPKARACTGQGIQLLISRITAVLVALYFFLVGLDLMGRALLVLGGKGAAGLFASAGNPIKGLVIGVLATALVQSSSTSTSIIVGLVGAGQISVREAIPVVMGANVGTSITNTIVSIVHTASPTELEHAFAGATVHEMFNLLTVLFLLPTEIVVASITGDGGPLYLASKAVTEAAVGAGARAVTFSSPTKSIVAPLTDYLLDPNKNVMKAVSLGSPLPREVPAAVNISLCSAWLNCEEYFCVSTSMQKAWRKLDLDGFASLTKCSHVLSFPDGCVQSSDCYLEAGKFFEISIEGARTLDSGIFARVGDVVGGTLGLLLSFVLVAGSLLCLVTVLNALLAGWAKKMVRHAAQANDYLAVVLGFAVTAVVQSSSVTTSTLIPLCAMQVLPMQKMLPITIGANLGTTCTSLIAALALLNPDTLQIALCHLFFNIFGLLMWFPVPFIRALPVKAACMLGFYASCWRMFPVIYVPTTFIALPSLCLAISLLYDRSIVAGVMATALFVMILAVFVVWWWMGGCYMVISKEIRRERAEQKARELELAGETPKEETLIRSNLSKSTQDAQLVVAVESEEPSETQTVASLQSAATEFCKETIEAPAMAQMNGELPGGPPPVTPQPHDGNVVSPDNRSPLPILNPTEEEEAAVSPAHLAVDCEFYKNKSRKLMEENDSMRERMNGLEDMVRRLNAKLEQQEQKLRHAEVDLRAGGLR
ncbi:SLC34A1 [Symbiodinium necroappetens]|uniref:SLC34A1 protein n=1 Tax=Symbiodinium necroappetens TaxID=1628268 RepID=A0A812X1F8_9DINO|nr:SLC34A1 [Symbiodinium necroappetens]